MFTVCPKCSLKLVVTAADLRVAQGFVRCGRCSNVFNALAGLTDEQQAALDREAPQPQGQTRKPVPPPNPVAPPSSASTAARAGTPAGPSTSRAPPATGSAPAVRNAPAPPAPPAAAATVARPTTAAARVALIPPEPPEPRGASARPGAQHEAPRVPDAALEFNPAATDVSTVFVHSIEAFEETASGTFESIVLSSEAAEGEDVASEHTATEDAAPQSAARRGSSDSETIQFELDAITTRLEAAHAAGAADRTATASSSETARGSAAAIPLARGAARTLEADAASTDSAEVSFLPERGVSRRQSLLYGVGALLLALLLAGQLTHHYRSELAGIGALRRPLTSLYGFLGLPLVRHWDVHAYEVHQLGAFAGVPGPGELTVRASLKNTAPTLQPLPLLRVTVQDSFGNRVAARDVPPAAYLKSGAAPRDFLAAGQRIDAEVAFVDPGQNAVGFEIDACLELSAGRIACANDTSAR